MSVEIQTLERHFGIMGQTSAFKNNAATRLDSGLLGSLR